jgi:hypothetical protein
MGSNTQIVIKFVEANKNVVVAFAAQNKLIEMSADDVKTGWDTALRIVDGFLNAHTAHKFSIPLNKALETKNPEIAEWRQTLQSDLELELKMAANEFIIDMKLQQAAEEFILSYPSVRMEQNEASAVWECSDPDTVLAFSEAEAGETFGLDEKEIKFFFENKYGQTEFNNLPSDKKTAFKTDEKGKLQHLYLDAQGYYQDLRETICETLIAIAQNETTNMLN